MERNDIRGQVPPDMESRLIAGEKVYYHASSGGGCLGLKPKTYFLITDDRVLFSSREKAGCFGIMQSTGSQAIPLAHISAIGTEASGCTALPFLRQGVIAISSAGGRQEALFSKPADAEEAARILQEILREKKQ